MAAVGDHLRAHLRLHENEFRHRALHRPAEPLGHARDRAHRAPEMVDVTHARLEGACHLAVTRVRVAAGDEAAPSGPPRGSRPRRPVARPRSWRSRRGPSRGSRGTPPGPGRAGRRASGSRPSPPRRTGRRGGRRRRGHRARAANRPAPLEQASSIRSSCPGEPVVVVGNSDVVPWRACARVAVRTASTVPSMKSAPSPPWTWISTKPGAMKPPCASTTSAPPPAISDSRPDRLDPPVTAEDRGVLEEPVGEDRRAVRDEEAHTDRSRVVV